MISTLLMFAFTTAATSQSAESADDHLARFLKDSDEKSAITSELSGGDPNPDLVRKPERGATSTEVSLTYSQEFLSKGRGVWREGSLGVIHKFSARKVLYGSFVETERFERRDRQANIGFYQPIDEKWTLLLEASASPTHRVLSKWSAMAQVERSLGNGWIAQAGYRRTEFDNAKVNVAKLGVEKYWGMNRAYYSLSVNNLENTGTSPSQRFQYNRYYGENLGNIGMGFSFGREIENVGNNQVLKSDIYNISVNGKHWFNRNWGSGYGFTFHKQGEFYNRRGLQFGIHYKF